MILLRAGKHVLPSHSRSLTPIEVMSVSLPRAWASSIGSMRMKPSSPKSHLCQLSSAPDMQSAIWNPGYGVSSMYTRRAPVARSLASVRSHASCDDG